MEEAQKLTALKWFTKEHMFGDVASEGLLTYLRISHIWGGGTIMLDEHVKLYMGYKH